jgi:hypothetical protein
LNFKWKLLLGYKNVDMAFDFPCTNTLCRGNVVVILYFCKP